MNRIPVPSMTGPFAQVATGRVEFARLSKATLTDLSHVLENIIIESEMPAAVFTGFQTGRNWTAELARYERLVRPTARSVAVFAAGNLGPTGDVLAFELLPRSPLTQEWFVIALTDQFSCALFGEDNPDDVAPLEEMDRVFDAAWTFEPTLVHDLCQVVLREASALNPQRAEAIAEALERFPARPADPAFEARFTGRVFETMEAGRRRWRRELVRSHDVQDRLQRSNAEVVRLERLAAVGTTAASLAHELNNPLAAIQMIADLLQMNAAGNTLDPTLVAEWGAAVAELTARAGRMTRGILDLVRVHDAVTAQLDLQPWLQRLAEELSMAARRPVQVQCHPAVTAEVDEERLRHIVTNLVNNAFHASPAGSAVEVEVADGSSPSTVAIRVVDHGHGVPDDMRDTLFEPFRTSRAAEGGTGLGLALAQRFAEDQNGQLELTSTGPDGSVFTLTVPRGQRVEIAPEPAAPTTAPSEHERRILVIDDDEHVRALLGHLLRQSGWEVWTAATPAEAEDAVAARAYDAVLADFHLGDDTDTTTMIRRLDSIRPGTSRRSIVITGSLTRELPVDELPPVLLKPFSRAELESAIADRIEGAGSA